MAAATVAMVFNSSNNIQQQLKSDLTKNNDTPKRGDSKLIADKTIAPVSSQEMLGNPSQGSIGFLRNEGGLTHMTKYA